MTNQILTLSVLTTLLCSLVTDIEAHGRLVDPPSRNAMWVYGFPNKPNYNLNELNCGGSKNHWEIQGGKCGLCGDPYQGPRKHEASYIGGYANGIIGRVYKEGQLIDIRVDVTANHFGWFEFSLCPSNGNPVTEECFNRYKLADARGQTRHRLTLAGYKGTVNLKLRLPNNLICSQCVLQWFWFAGNNRDRIPQETFVNCADVVITRRDGRLDGGLVMPEILPQAYQPIPENNHTLGEGTLIGLPGEWDCTVPSPYDGPKRQVYKEWCLENCLYSLPHQRSCPVETCRCYRSDEYLDSNEERRLLGITDEYPDSHQGGSGSTSQRTSGTLDGDWECEVVSPYSHNDYYDWCVYHCLEALPNERDCAATHCKCWRTDQNLGSAEESRQLLPVQSQRSTAVTTRAPASLSNRENTNWKSSSKISSRPNGLEGRWDCDIISPYNVATKRLHYYEWCLENCVNALPNDRFCPGDICNCYRTDVQLSKDELRAQLEGGQVQTHNIVDSERRGIPPSLVGIIEYSESLKTDKSGQLPGLQGDWDCQVVFALQHKEGAEKKREQLRQWCLDMCIRPQPNDRYCPDSHCRCYRTDVRQSDAENRRQLGTGVTVKGIIHAESGEDGTLENDWNRPDIGRGRGSENQPDELRYTCEAIAPFNTGSQGQETVKYCYDSCVREIPSQRHCPTSHCRCYERGRPENVLRTAEPAQRRTSLSQRLRSSSSVSRQQPPTRRQIRRRNKRTAIYK